MTTMTVEINEFHDEGSIERSNFNIAIRRSSGEVVHMYILAFTLCIMLDLTEGDYITVRGKKKGKGYISLIGKTFKIKSSINEVVREPT